MTRPIIGIDPGQTGAVAAIWPDGRAEVHDLPYAGNQTIPAALADTIRQLDPVAAFVEEVGAMPKQGVASSFRFGQGHGVILGILAGAGIPTHRPPASQWKKAMGLGTDKNVSRRRAAELFPSIASMLTRVKDDGRAEAVLLAEHGRRQIAAGKA